MRRRPPRSTLTDTRFPCTTLFRSVVRISAFPPMGCTQSAKLAGEQGRRNRRGAGGRFRTRLRNARMKSRQPSSANIASVIKIRSEEHTSELQSLMRNSYAVFCLQKKRKTKTQLKHMHQQ